MPHRVVALKREEARFGPGALGRGASELEGGDALEPRRRSALHHPDRLARERAGCRARASSVLAERNLLAVLRLAMLAACHLLYGPMASGREPRQRHRSARAAAPLRERVLEFDGHVAARVTAASELEEESEALRLEQLAQPARPAVPTAAHDYEGSRGVLARHHAVDLRCQCYVAAIQVLPTRR